ncbi:hypothetical protein FSP39_023113 [Pinctada imbricata]|uniref:Uncharacterized protein n=1 Tax=Pinctada imbricata TaxID=66713 RepID=A0AA88XLC6_PINIB|nr:hypothetical protein FSP39_023113 [Pinctada imbricata]
MFWFGTDYSIRCPDPHGSLECSNPMPHHHDSLVSRLFGDSVNFHSTPLDRYIDVHFYSQKGQYNSCGYIWDSGDDLSFSIDPLSMDSFTPWDTRNMPNISWIAPSSDEHYTLIVMDPGYLMAHGIYINIPGNFLPDGEAIMEYHVPEHIFSFHNIYTFLLFKQNGSISLSHEWETKLKHKYIRNIYTIPDLMEAYGLMGPVAMTWMRIKGDPYAIQLHIDQGEYYACPYLMEAEINKHNRSFIPHHTRMTVDVEITFSPPAIAFTSCCSAFYYDHRVVKLNPLGNSSVRCGDVRTGVDPSVVLTRLGLMKESKMFNNSLYTLLCVDPDVPTPSFGTPDFPLLHWLISNIEDGDLPTGHVVMKYSGPAPLNNLGHTYYFLLYEQTMELNVS